ncbi:hypothetical protein SMSP2_02061 [Limihaloglobus sulfuriphilus]|uniref:Laminin G domain-containing protein n=1 Tax=Limihaloglobus sulfuriphilus TaxID=1851148 RepID=A0A1Q2MGB1_9BACT|nr:LamG-like jellyroll fold domain-containing protein [Limihaloglobus sulfuriphilus]AQQ71684.1 hypothetical protein SMSP2_02061 [Limihaloglobus sulfuriphilus]
MSCIPANKQILLLFCALLALSCSGQVLFYNSFENPEFEADYAAGTAKALYHDMLKPVEGKTGQGIWCKPNEYIRFETDENISLEEGTILFWVKPNYTPPRFRQEFGREMQALFSIRIRTDHLIQLRLINDKTAPRLRLMTGGDNNKKSNINIDIPGWQKDQWHQIMISWKQPGRLALAVDDQKPVAAEDAHLPLMPEAMLYDMFFGTNSKQSRVFQMEHFDGVIDEVYIFDEWLVRDKPQIKPKAKKPKLPSHVTAQPDWVSENSQRLNFYVKPESSQWQNVPVKSDIDLGLDWKKLSPQRKRAAINNFRLVRFDTRTGRPVVYDEKLDGHKKYFRPFTVTSEIYSASKAVLRFVHAGTEEAGYSFCYDLNHVYDSPFPLEIPMVGNGDRLRIGLKTSIGNLAGTIAGVFDVGDIDGDGDLDIWLNSGTVRTPKCSDLMTGHYFYENISNETGVENIYAPAKLIIRDNTPTGYISGVVIPVIADINHDGKDDLLMLGRSCQEWWEWEFINDKPVVTKIHKLRFEGPVLDTEIKTFWFDWDGDGLGDVITSELPNIGKDEVTPIVRVYRNVGTKENPAIDTNNPQDIAVDKVDLQWCYIPVDWDCDGDIDFISSGFTHEMYFHENIGGTKTAPKFAAAKRLKTMDRREITIPNSVVTIKIADKDQDGDMDILWGSEAGCIGFVENIAGPGRMPVLRNTVYLQQVRPILDAGAINIPKLVDWDDDGDKDIIAGASNAIVYFENQGSDDRPLWKWGEDMTAGGFPIWLPAGDDGSVQGIEELGWQYNNPEVADWDGDGLKDLIMSGIRGEHHFFKNIGRKGSPRLAKGQLIKVDWQGEPLKPAWLPFQPVGNELITVWRTKPVAMDWNNDGLCDYITLDHKGAMALYLRAEDPNGKLILKPGKNIFEIDGPYSQGLVWNRPENATRGRSGRTIINITDWDKDGDYDLVYDNVNARYYENTRDNQRPLWVDRGDLVKERLTNHNAGPALVDWDNDGSLDLFVGSESGRIFYFSRAYIDGPAPTVIQIKNEEQK